MCTCVYFTVKRYINTVFIHAGILFLKKEIHSPLSTRWPICDLVFYLGIENNNPEVFCDQGSLQKSQCHTLTKFENMTN